MLIACLPSPDLGELDLDTVETLMKRYGKTLVKERPEAATGLLMQLCTGKYRTKETAEAGSSSGTGGLEEKQNGTGRGNSNRRCDPEQFINLYVDHPDWLQLFLDHVLKEVGRVSTIVANTLLELLLRDWMRADRKMHPHRHMQRRGEGSGSSGRGGGSSLADPLGAPLGSNFSPADPLLGGQVDVVRPPRPPTGLGATAGGLGAAASERGEDEGEGEREVDMETQAKIKKCSDAVMNLLRNNANAPYDRYHALVLVQVAATLPPPPATPNLALSTSLIHIHIVCTFAHHTRVLWGVLLMWVAVSGE